MILSNFNHSLSHKITALFCLFFITFTGTLFFPASSGYSFTIGEEREVGEKLLYMVRKKFKLIDDPDIIQYFNRLGNDILKTAGPQYYSYHFFLVQDNKFNAFAAPSGLIFFYSGLVETMQSEDELVSVMAHEVGHVKSRHLAHRIEKNKKISIGTMALGLASLAIGNPALAQGLLAGTLAAGQTLGLRFSRLDEEQADRLSFSWMQDMHRNPHAMEKMLQTMRRITRYRMGGEIPPYLLTHPQPEVRLLYVKSLLDFDEKQKEEGYYKPTDNFSFLRMKYRILTKIKDASELRNYYNEILSSDSKGDLQKTMARYGMALLYANELHFDKAIQALNTVRKELPDRNILKVDSGVLFFESGNIDQARQILSEARTNDPTDMYAAFQLARVLQQNGMTHKAEQLYITVSETIPDFSKSFFEIGKIQSSQGHIGEGYYSLAQYHLTEGNLKQAKQFLNRAMNASSSTQLTKDKADSLLKRIIELEKD